MRRVPVPSTATATSARCSSTGVWVAYPTRRDYFGVAGEPGQLVEPKSLEEEIERAKTPAPPGKVLIPGKVTWLVPEPYSRLDQSTLKAEVKPGENTIDFDIP